MATLASFVRNRVASRLLLVAAILLGAFATTSAVTGWIYLKDGPIDAELGRVNGGEGSHSLLLQADGVRLDIAVPLVDWWGEAEITSRAVSPGELFLGVAPVQVARDYLSGSSYAAARPAGESTWKVFPVPGSGAPPDPSATVWTYSSIGRSARVPVTGDDSAMVLVRLDGGEPVIADMGVQFSSPRARLYTLLFVLLATGCFALSLYLVIRDPWRPRSSKARSPR